MHCPYHVPTVTSLSVKCYMILLGTPIQFCYYDNMVKAVHFDVMQVSQHLGKTFYKRYYVVVSIVVFNWLLKKLGVHLITPVCSKPILDILKSPSLILYYITRPCQIMLAF